MLPLHQSSICIIKPFGFNHKKKQDHRLAFFNGGGEETRTLTPCGAGT